jgi:transposase-like protein
MFKYKNYDGAAVMASELNGLQAKIKSFAPQAIFTNCYTHALNLIMGKACNSI